jgi:hypothetical protein
MENTKEEFIDIIQNKKMENTKEEFIDIIEPLKQEPIVFDYTHNCREAVYEQLNEYGCCQLDNVLSPDQIKKSLNLSWNLIEEMSPAIDRDDSRTWSTGNRPDNQSGMIQSLAGWTKAQIYVREKVIKVFKMLYLTKQLDCSADGLTFSGLLKNRKKTIVKKVHFDAGIETKVDCIQGVVNLLDQNKGDACFGCYPGSHKYHGEIIKGKKNWYALNDDEKQLLESKGLKYTRFPLPAGSMMLFYSKTAHAQSQPYKCDEVQKHRIVHYVSMLPKEKDPIMRKKTMEKKRKAYDENRATSHWANHRGGRMELFAKKLGSRYKRDVSSFKKAKKVSLEDIKPYTKYILGLIDKIEYDNLHKKSKLINNI